MPQINLDIPPGVTVRVVDAICTRNGYTGFLADRVTPQTKQQFVKAWLISKIKDEVKYHEITTATDTARTTTITDVDTNIIIS